MRITAKVTERNPARVNVVVVEQGRVSELLTFG